ncbi:ornithine carbamoyltransferase [Candidatus Bipolaricaulota bacterium]|nr:ornithine carbamoyltransferase [Candidatus Bipolaricaulota bacterium]
MSWFDLSGKSLISETDWTKEEMDNVLRVAKQLKASYYSGDPTPVLEYKTMLMLFFSGSTRTRLSFEAAMTQLGGHSQFLAPGTMRLSLEEKPGAGESIKDTAKVMGRYGDGVGIRLLDDQIDYYGQGNEVMRKVAEHADIPVYNMASDVNHPCQSLTDMLTIQEKLGKAKGNKIVLTWAYSPWVRGRCSIQGTALISSMYGMDVVVAHPEEYDLDPDVTATCEQEAEKSGGSFEVSNDMDEALDGATIVFPRNWYTADRYEIGKEKELEIANKHQDWIYTGKKQKELCDPGYFLHCMPVDRGNEADHEVCDNELSWMYDQAENRLHSQKAVLATTMK